MKDGGPAFPVQIPSQWSQGMSLRDYFAAAALTGYLAGQVKYDGQADPFEYLAKDCYHAADSMLAERAKSGS